MPEVINYAQLLVHCQEQVALRTPGYARTYRPEELYYWTHLPFWLARDLPRGPQVRVLDIGCAYGTLALYSRLMTGGQTYCVDMVEGGLAPDLARTFGLHFAPCNIERDPFPWDIRFDAILLTEVLEHFNFHPVPTLKRIRALMAGGGRLYLSTPDAGRWGRERRYATYRVMPAPNPALPVTDAHIYLYDWLELQEIFAEAELRPVELDFAPGCNARRHFNIVLAAA